MGGLTALNQMQNTPMQIRAIALDAPLVSIDNLWKSPTWTQAGDYKNTVWYLLAKMYNFSFEELNEAHSTDFTLDTFPFNTDDSGYNYTYVQELYSYNKAKIAGFDPFIPTSKDGETEYKYMRCPVKIWRGSEDSATGRLPYCKNLVSKVRNAYCKVEEKYPPYSKHCLSTGTASDGIQQVTVDNYTGYPVLIGANEGATPLTFIEVGMVNGQRSYNLRSASGTVVQCTDGTLLVVPGSTDAATFTFADRDGYGLYDMKCGSYYYYKSGYSLACTTTFPAEDYDGMMPYCFSIEDALQSYNPTEDERTGLFEG